MSVKSKILQFQTQSSPGDSSQPPSLPSFFAAASPNSNGSNGGNGNQIKPLLPASKPPRTLKIQTESFQQSQQNSYVNSSSSIRSSSSSPFSPTKTRAPTPPEMKKSPTKTTSLTINLNGSAGANNGGNGTSASSPFSPPPLQKNISPAALQSPTRMRSPEMNSTSNGTQNNGHSADAVTFRRPSNSSGFLRRGAASASPEPSIDWKGKFEDSEKKRIHTQSLAQKATRDYEELLRRYQDTSIEKAKVANKLKGAIEQLDALRTASEATYDEYHKLKKKYDYENRAKAEALGRVDQYNRENRRLKRQSQLMMQHLNDPAFTIPEESEVEDAAENDKEIDYLRKRVQELETKIIDLESDLERTKLAEFETQESVMLMNDTVHTTKSEKSKLQEAIKSLQDENRKLRESLDDARIELDHIKGKDALERERLRETEAQLRKVQTEKNILHRQSLAFMSDAVDDRLLDALTQISQLQSAMAEQKNSFDHQLEELRNKLTEKETQEETNRMKNEAKILALEEQVQNMRTRAEEAEKKLEEYPDLESSGQTGHGPPAPPPPPPPPPMMNMPPPPPLPHGGTSLSSQLANKAGSLNRAPSVDINKSNKVPSELNGQPALGVGDVLSGLKNLKPANRATARRPSEKLEASPESVAVEEMRAVLNRIGRKSGYRPNLK